MYYLDKEYLLNHTREEILEETGMSVATLHNYEKRYKVKVMNALHKNIFNALGTMSDSDIAAKYGVTKSMVSTMRRKYKIPRFKGYHGKYTYEQLQELHDTYGSWEKAGKAIGVSKQNLSEVANKLGFKTKIEHSFTREEIDDILLKYGNFSRAARELNIGREVLYNWYHIYHKNERPKKERKYSLKQLIVLHDKYGSWEKASVALGLARTTLNVIYNYYLNNS